MRLWASLICLFVLAACATAPEGLPQLRYADAASRGALSAFFAGRPSAAQVERVTNTWSEALRDSFACNVPGRDVLNAGLVGALEIGAMNAAAQQRGDEAVREGVSRYLSQVVNVAMQNRTRPEDGRCAALAAWAPRVAQDGREAVERARERGLIGADYERLMGLYSLLNGR